MGKKQKMPPEEKGKLMRRLLLGEINQAQAAEEAGVWKIPTQRWLARYEVEGIAGFCHMRGIVHTVQR